MGMTDLERWTSNSSWEWSNVNILKRLCDTRAVGLCDIGGALAALVTLAWATTATAVPADLSRIEERSEFSSVLLQQGRVQVDADWNETGEVQNGQVWAGFEFAFDPDVVALAGTQGIVGGLAVGTLDGNLGGDQGFTLHLSPGTAVNAFGVEIAYEDPSLLDFFRLVVDCPDPPCAFGSTPAKLQTGVPGTFFLGVVARLGFEFDTVTMQAVTPRNDQGEALATVPGWQVAGISFALVPAPGALWLTAIGLAAMNRASRPTRVAQTRAHGSAVRQSA